MYWRSEDRYAGRGEGQAKDRDRDRKTHFQKDTKQPLRATTEQSCVASSTCGGSLSDLPSTHRDGLRLIACAGGACASPFLTGGSRRFGFMGMELSNLTTLAKVIEQPHSLQHYHLEKPMATRDQRHPARHRTIAERSQNKRIARLAGSKGCFRDSLSSPTTTTVPINGGP